MSKLIEDYKFIVSFTKRFGSNGKKCGFEFWEYNDGETRIFVRDFFKTSSFLIIESKALNETALVVYYQKTNIIKLVDGTEEILSYVFEKTVELAPIKDLLRLRS